jgi:hypothetical protein
MSGAESLSPLVSTAMEFLARASSTSEVLTLNITNLIILLIAKAIIIGFGIFAGGVGGQARSSEQSPAITKSDLTGGMCFMMYTSGEESKLSCIQRTACADPKTAAEYVTAAKMWYKVHKLLNVPFDTKYETVLNALEDAKSHALSGGDCSIYKW